MDLCFPPIVRKPAGNALFGLLLVTLSTMATASPCHSAPPNVLLIISDDQSWTDFGFMGHPTIRTPHIDRLARQSAVFPNAYVPSSLCRPSLATMVTGLYPHQHGITGNDPPRGTDRSKMLKHIQAHPTLPRWLATKGYRSLQTGKWWEGHPRLAGFTDAMTHGDPKRGGRHGDLGLKIGRTGLKPIIEFIDDCGEKPFFIWYAPFLPHTPHNPPKRLLARYRAEDRPIEVSRYYAMCTWFDETCGQLLDHLDRKQLSDNTLVLFVVDNGWIQRTPQPEVPKGWRFRFAPGSKRSPNEGGVRTPIMVRWPGHIKPGTRQALASSIDLAPTILAATDVRPEKTLPGHNLLALAADPHATRETIYGEIFAHDVADIDRPAASLQFRWVRHGGWKLISRPGSTTPQLFNLANDPHETRNVAGSQSDRASRMRQLLDNWWDPARRQSRP